MRPEYSRYLHKDFIYRDVKEIPTIVDKIWKLQEAQTKIYNLVNDIRLLRSMCRLIPDEAKSTVNEQLKKITDADVARRIYKRTILLHKDHIMSNTENELFRQVA